jgi:hypothetical protein
LSPKVRKKVKQRKTGKTEQSQQGQEHIQRVFLA